MEQLQLQPQPTGVVDDSKMQLTEEERHCALAIKNAIESSDHLATSSVNIMPMCDFQYAYLAIACRGKTLEHILYVAYKMQRFWELYELNASPQVGVNLIRDLMELMPGLILDLSFLPSEQCFSISVDMGALRPERVQTEAQWKIYLGGLYYVFQAMKPDFSSIRTGYTGMVECETMGFHNFDYTFIQKQLVEVWSWFPLMVKDEYWFSAPIVATIIYEMSKSIASRERMEKWKLLRRVEGYDGSINALFLMPTPEIAQQRLLSRIEMYLWQRYHNEQTFSLLT